jgi:hypothetical protein
MVPKGPVANFQWRKFSAPDGQRRAPPSRRCPRLQVVCPGESLLQAVTGRALASCGRRKNLVQGYRCRAVGRPADRPDGNRRRRVSRKRRYAKVRRLLVPMRLTRSFSAFFTISSSNLARAGLMISSSSPGQAPRQSRTRSGPEPSAMLYPKILEHRKRFPPSSMMGTKGIM